MIPNVAADFTAQYCHNKQNKRYKQAIKMVVLNLILSKHKKAVQDTFQHKINLFEPGVAIINVYIHHR